MRLFEIITEAYEPGEYGGKHNLHHGQGLGQQQIPPTKYEIIGDVLGRKLDPSRAYWGDVCSQCHGSGKNYSPTAGKIQPGNPHQNATGGEFGGGCGNKNCTAGFLIGAGHKVIDAGPISPKEKNELSSDLEFEIGKAKDNPSPETRAFTSSSDTNARLFIWLRARADAGDQKLGRIFLNVVSGKYTADLEDEFHTIADAYSKWKSDKDKEKELSDRNMDPGLAAAARLKPVHKGANQKTIGTKASKYKR